MQSTVCLALAAFMLLSACASTNPAQQVLVACQGYASTLTVLAAPGAAGKLSDTKVTLVNRIRPGFNKICEKGIFTDQHLASEQVNEG